MQRIFLTGLSGAGKSTIGRRVASLLNWDFVDTDELLARQMGQSTGQVLLGLGEARFRELESEMLLSAASQERVVIATGGGMIISDTNRTFMHEQGLVVFLHASPDIAWSRIQAHLQAAGEQAVRPLVAGQDGQQRLHDLYAVRSHWYEQAHVQFSTDTADPAEVAQDVLVSALTRGYLLANDSARISSTLRLTSGLSQAVVEWGSFSQLPAILTAQNFSGRIFIVTDSSVGRLYAESVRQLLAFAGFKPFIFSVPAGESSKSLTCFAGILDWLVEHKAERSELLIALGGGVVGDLVGFVASAYRRGMALAQLPTTLLAQVDSSIGGKTGINHARGKNLIGAYYQPGLILVDPALLLTLPDRAYREGWGEVVKYGIVLDAELFALLEEHLSDVERREADLLTQVVARCIRLKMDVVQSDERDGGLRNILNYGHTFGHALEATTSYGTWLHGEAVSIGMEVAGRIAVAQGLFTREELVRQRKLLRSIGLPLACPGEDSAVLLAAMQNDKKVQAGRIRWILPTRIGYAQMYSDVPVESVCAAITAVCQPAEELL